jgi:hypothetical protein
LRLEERTLTAELSIVDVLDDLIWHRDGRVTLVYELVAFHEPGMSDAEFDSAALRADSVWSSGLPEGSDYQFIVVVDKEGGRVGVEACLPPIPQLDERARVLEEFRRGRLAQLTRASASSGVPSFVQARRHYVTASFRPECLEGLVKKGLPARLRALLTRARRPGRRWDDVYAGVLSSARRFERRVEYGLCQIALGFTRCETEDIIKLIHELLSPTTSRSAPLTQLSRRARAERDELPGSSVGERPYLGETSTAWSLVEDDMAVRPGLLEIGDRCVGVVTLKQLPDRTEPGILVPLLSLARAKYVLHYRVEIPPGGLELQTLRARARLAAGLRLQNFLVRTDRADPLAAAVEKQSDEAVSRIIVSTLRILGTSLSIALYEDSPDALEEGAQETIAVMARAHGLRGHRERYLVKEAFLATLPGSPGLPERRRRTLTPVAVDMMPVHGFSWGTGKIPFLTPSNSVVLYDPFDEALQSNANILVTGTSGWGKSFVASYVLSGAYLAAASRREPAPYTFILDNGASYEHYAQLLDGKYVPFTFDEPPGVEIFEWDEAAGGLDEHVSRLEWLLLDLLRVDGKEEERFERVKASVEEALKEHMYRGGLPRSFLGFAEALGRVGGPHADELRRALYPYTEGKFARLFEANARLAMAEGCHVICYDFKGLLGEHRDLAALALRLAIYEVRRWSARVSRRGHRTFLTLDESWALLDGSTSGSAVASAAGPFLASSIRMGRKEGMSVLSLSQVLEDFSGSAFGAAILGNSATRFVGHPGAEGVETLRRQLGLSERQVEQVASLRRTPEFHEFLLLRGERSDVIRVPGDPFSRWVFSTSPKERERIATLGALRPELSLFERMKLLAAEG